MPCPGKGWLAWRPTVSSIAVTCDRYTELTPGPVSGLRTFRGARPEVQYGPMRGGQFTSKEERHQLHRFQRPTLVLGKAGEARSLNSWSTDHLPQVPHCPGRVVQGSSAHLSHVLRSISKSGSPVLSHLVSLEWTSLPERWPRQKSQLTPTVR